VKNILQHWGWSNKSYRNDTGNPIFDPPVFVEKGGLSISQSLNHWEGGFSDSPIRNMFLDHVAGTPSHHGNSSITFPDLPVGAIILKHDFLEYVLDYNRQGFFDCGRHPSILFFTPALTSRRWIENKGVSFIFPVISLRFLYIPFSHNLRGNIC